jgi:hypothetical protein
LVFADRPAKKSSQFSRCEDRHRSESKEAVGERCPAEPVVRANAITLPFSVCAHRSSRGSLLTIGKKESKNIPPLAPGSEEKKKPFPWVAFGVPLGCAIGIALRNLAIDIAIGMLIAGAVSTVQARRSGRKISLVIYAAFGVSALAIATVLFLQK